jgi:hypothetical protein
MIGPDLDESRRLETLNEEERAHLALGLLNGFGFELVGFVYHNEPVSFLKDGTGLAMFIPEDFTAAEVWAAAKIFEGGAGELCHVRA